MCLFPDLESMSFTYRSILSGSENLIQAFKGKLILFLTRRAVIMPANDSAITIITSVANSGTTSTLNVNSSSIWIVPESVVMETTSITTSAGPLPDHWM